MNSLLLSILANLCSDSFKLNNRKDFKPVAIFWHGLIVFGLIFFFLHGYQLIPVIGYAALLTGIHLIIDLLTAILNRIKNQTINLVVYIAEQVLKLLSVFIIWSWFDLQSNPAILSFYERVFPVKALPSLAGITSNVVKMAPERFILGVIFYIYICFGGSDLIEKFLIWLRKQESAIVDHPDQTGRWIGILERLIVLSLILNNALGSVAFILTAKSIARFNELHNRDFAEYYLIGTLASTTLAICGGFLLSYLLKVIS